MTSYKTELGIIEQKRVLASRAKWYNKQWLIHPLIFSFIYDNAWLRNECFGNSCWEVSVAVMQVAAV